MTGLSTRRVGAEPGLMPRLAGGGSAPDYNQENYIKLKEEKPPFI